MKMQAEHIGLKLKAIRERAGYKSMRSFADALGKSSSSYNTYESGNFKKRFLPMDKIDEWAPLLVGRGEPAVTLEEILMLGVDPDLGNASIQPTRETSLTLVQGYVKQVENEEEIALIAVWRKMSRSTRKAMIILVTSIIHDQNGAPKIS